MNKFVKLLFLLGAPIWVSGCADLSQHMTAVQGEQKAVQTEPGKALVIFIRPSKSDAYSTQAIIYDEKKYIGEVSGGTHLAYLAKPGDHIFMVIGHVPAFIRAELIQGMSYCVRLGSRPGWGKANFRFIPCSKQVIDQKLKKWLQKTTRVKLSQKGVDWAIRNTDRINKMRATYLRKWDNEPKERKRILRANSGSM